MCMQYSSSFSCKFYLVSSCRSFPFLVTADKLSHIDTEFNEKLKSNANSGTVEERLLSYQRRIELATSQKAQQDFERWKRLEIETIQIMEREKIQRELQDRRRQVIGLNYIFHYDVISCWCCKSLLENAIFSVSDDRSREHETISNKVFLSKILTDF